MGHIRDKEIEYKDYITCSYNRSYMLCLLKEWAYRAKEEEDRGRAVLLYFNISGFKMYNEAFGMKEGDRCLKDVAEVLSDIFGKEGTARLSADHFACLSEDIEGLEKKVSLAHDRVFHLRDSFSLNLLTGILVVAKTDLQAENLDMAKIACDQLRNDSMHYLCYFTNELRESLEKRHYIQSAIDEAISHSYIKIYYQPVIRTLNGMVCSLEALTRWDDPKYGLISPADFVPLLEERHLSYKLDSYVVDQVTSMLKERYDRGLAIVPVSVNFSRRDFDVMDPFQLVSSMVKKKGLHPEWICVELTETTVMDAPEKIRDQMSRFHNAGYEVWMDDFGSAFSSLNSLKDFDFDEIKLDRGFLLNGSKKSLAIVRSVIQMAKELGVHTLAEGVETDEQLDALREMGCEKIQGYYYSRPLPLDQLLIKLENRNLVFENQAEKDFFDEVGQIDLNVKEPRAMISFHDDQIRLYYQNQAFREILMENGLTGKKSIEDALNRNQSFTSEKILKLIRSAILSNAIETAYLFYMGHYLRIRMKKLADSVTGSMLLVECTDATREEKGDIVRFDPVLRSLIQSYEDIYLVNATKQEIQVIQSSVDGENPGDTYIGKRVLELIWNRIYFKDQDRFRENSGYSCISQEMSRLKRDSFNALYRMIQKDGSIQWMEFTWVRIPGINQETCLFCIKPAAVSAAENPEDLVRLLWQDDWGSLAREGKKLGNRMEMEHLLFTALMEQSRIHFFWKDRERRFLGASRSFLNFYGFDSEKEIIGKTDEDQGWHIDGSLYKEDELKVITQGSTVYSVPGQNVLNGIIRNIQATKFPVYKDGKIVGLMGYFVDADKLLPKARAAEANLMKDPVTGFLSIQGFLSALSAYEDNYQKNREDYSLGILFFPSYDRIYDSFGMLSAENLILKIADILQISFQENCTVARVQKGTFAILRKTAPSRANFDERMKQCMRQIDRIHEIDGHAILTKVGYGSASRKETYSQYRLLAVTVGRVEIDETSSWKLTAAELEFRMAEYEKIFDKVHIVNVPSRSIVEPFRSDPENMEDGFCWKHWGMNERCRDCLAARAMARGGKEIAIQHRADGTYLMLAHPLLFQGKEYCLEAEVRVENEALTSKRHIALPTFQQDKEYIDPVTGLRNRRYFEEQLAGCRAGALAAIEILNYRKLQDLIGKEKAEGLLRELGQILQDSFRKEDLLFHYDGGEFIAILDQISEETLKGRLHLIRNAAESILAMHGAVACQIRVAIGAVYGEGDIEDLIFRAEKNLYLARREKKGILLTESDKESFDSGEI